MLNISFFSYHEEITKKVDAEQRVRDEHFFMPHLV